MTAGVTAGGEAPAEACAPARDNPFNSDDSISPMVKTVSPSKTLEVCVGGSYPLLSCYNTIVTMKELLFVP